MRVSYLRSPLSAPRFPLSAFRMDKADVADSGKRVAGSAFRMGPMLSPSLLARLRCPACKKPLPFRETSQDFRCEGCKRVYPVRDGIPVLLVDEAKLEN